jgi:hypothetical protein
MQLRQLSIESKGYANRRRASFGRIFLALLIACAISLSVFHGWTADAEAGELPVASTIASADTVSQAPIQQAPPHADHCLTHLASMLWQSTVSEPVQFGETAYPRRAEVRPADRAGASPFKPPCG